MDVLYQSCAGIDIHQANIVVCILHGPLTSTRPKREMATFDTTTKDLHACHDFLSQFHVEAVGMESTGVYWRPVWHALCDDFELILAQQAHMKAIQGQKTDKKDAHWIAKLTRIGLLPRCFVPNETIQELRELTRQRKHYVESRNRETNRIHKILQSGGIKLTTYIEAIMGLSGRNLLQLLVDRMPITPRIVHQSVYTSLKKKVPQLLEALDGYFSDHHRFMLKQSLEIYDFFQKQIELLEEQINGYLSQYENHVEILDSIPGIDVITASMSRVGKCIDNAPIKSFFGHFKTECYDLKKYKTFEELVSDIDAYIYFYNHQRFQERNNGLAPLETRNKAVA
ncbi:TPA: IS110 family transposase [Streptococcus suis]